MSVQEWSQIFKRPEWQNRDPNRRLRAVESSSDQTLLLQVAASDPAPPVRLAAVKKLQDDNTLYELLQREQSPHVQRAIAQTVGSQSTLKRIALDRYIDLDTRIEAILRITNQQVLEHLALSDCSKAIRAACVSKLINKDVLLHVVEDDRSREVVKIASARLQAV